MTDIVSRIDSVLSCIVCSKELPVRCGSDDWCGDACYRAWQIERNDTRFIDRPPSRPTVDTYQPAWMTLPVAGELAGYEPIPPANPPRASMLRDTSQLLVAFGVFLASQFGKRSR